jgi:hypothetical protein
MVAKFRAKVEFKAIAHGVCEMLWLKISLKELEDDSRDFMSCAINVAYNPLLTYSSM